MDNMQVVYNVKFCCVIFIILRLKSILPISEYEFERMKTNYPDILNKELRIIPTITCCKKLFLKKWHINNWKGKICCCLCPFIKIRGGVLLLIKCSLHKLLCETYTTWQNIILNLEHLLSYTLRVLLLYKLNISKRIFFNWLSWHNR